MTNKNAGSKTNSRTQSRIETRSLRRRIVFVATLIGLSAAAIGMFNVSGAEAVIKQKTNLTISERFPAFHGKVSSPAEHCEDRVVKLLKVRDGRDKLIGKDRTNSAGRWKVIVDRLKTASYYAKVGAISTKDFGERQVCMRDRSRKVFVD